MADCRKCRYNYKPSTCEPKCNRMCDGESEFEHITNADRIRSMSDEELAEFISKYFSCEYECAVRDKCGSDWDCKRATIDWLQSDAE